MTTRRIKRLAIGAVLLFLLLAVGSCYVALTYREEGRHVPRVSWLPAGASDVSYFRTVLVVAYECRIGEAGFLDLARARGWEPRPIREPVTATRPAWFTSTAPREEDFPGDPERFHRESAAWIERTLADVEDGYTAGDRKGDEGASVVYDRRSSRLYYFWTGR